METLKNLFRWLHSLVARPIQSTHVEPAHAEPCDARSEAPRPTLSALLWLAPLPGGLRLVEVTWLEGDEPVVTEYDVGSNLSRNGLVLDRFEALYRQVESRGQVLDLWLACRPVRDEIVPLASSFPQLVMRREATARHRAMRTLAEAHVTPTAAAQPRLAPLSPATPRLTVATDASAGSSGRGMGLACVSEGGEWMQEYADTGVSSTLGEILAIDLALRTYPDRRLAILTDSRAALKAIACQGFDHPRAPREALQRIAHAMASERVTLTWVRGHAAHPLNEAADRLALAARRGVQLGQPIDVRQTVAAGIVLDLLNATQAAA